MSAYAAVLVTFRRPEWLSRSLDAVLGQTVAPAFVVVVDNDADPSIEALVGTMEGPLHYVAAPSNEGPAGGIHLGIEALDVLDPAGDVTQLLFLDDDDPLPGPDVVARLLDLRRRLEDDGTRVGVVGMAGARWDDRWARLSRPANHELIDAVAVDYIGGNQAPLYDRAALRDVGDMDPTLFCFFEDLDLGLRLRRGGYGLFADGGLWEANRRQYDRLEVSRTPRGKRAEPAWRSYYHARNLVLVLRAERSRRQAALATVRSLAGSLRRREHVRVVLRGLLHGWTGRRDDGLRPPLDAT